MRIVQIIRARTPLLSCRNLPSGVRSALAALCCAVALAATSPLSPAHAEALDSANEPAVAFVQGIGDKVVDILKEPSSILAERQKSFRALFQENFDAPVIGRAVLGPHWNELSDSEKTRYLELFSNYVAAIYAVKFARYSGDSFRITGAHAGASSDPIVTAEIIQPDKPVLEVGFRVRTTAEGMKVVDVTVEQISLIINMRKEFAEVMSKEGKDGLLKRLQALVMPLNAPIVQK